MDMCCASVTHVTFPHPSCHITQSSCDMTLLPYLLPYLLPCLLSYKMCDASFDTTYSSFKMTVSSCDMTDIHHLCVCVWYDWFRSVCVCDMTDLDHLTVMMSCHTTLSSYHVTHASHSFICRLLIKSCDSVVMSPIHLCHWLTCPDHDSFICLQLLSTTTLPWD